MILSAANRQRLRALVRDSGWWWTATLLLDGIGLPTLRWWPARTVAPATLAEQAAAILRALGMSEAHLAITVRHLLYADLHGIDSHGCSMLPHYHRQWRQGLFTMTPTIATARETETTALVDGGGGLGHVPAETAMKLAMAKCRAAGVGVVAVRNSGHFGAAGSYAALAAKDGLIGLATTTIRQPAVVPTFGRQAILGTNPLAFAAPAARNQPFLLDMATSTVPLGRVAVARRQGRTIPAGWALDHRGKPVRKASRALAGRRLTPLGGTRELGSHKGYGLAAMVEILAAGLAGDSGEGRRVAHFFLALDPACFVAGEQFKASLDALMDGWRACEPLTPEQPVLVAGDPEYAAAADRQANGIPLPRQVVEELRGLCRAAAIPFLLEPAP